MGTQQKINTGLLLGLLIVLALWGYSSHKRSKSDDAFVALMRKTDRVIIADSVLRAELQPKVDSAIALSKQLERNQQVLKTQNAYMARYNENLHKQIDSLNAVLGLRPDF